MNPRLLPLLLAAAFAATALSASAGAEKRTYLHRSRGADLRTVNLMVEPAPDGGLRYSLAGLFGNEKTLFTFATGPDGRPREFANTRGGGFETRFVFAPGQVAFRQIRPDADAVETNVPVDPAAWPDFNSRPDPYLTAHALLRAYDFDHKGRQFFAVFDVDDTGQTLVPYQISLEWVDDDGVVLPNGRFRARHLVQVQQSSAPTWYKKRRGSQTDFWVDAEGRILRIYRHREPYEVILQNYVNPRALLAKTESAQGYPQPATHAVIEEIERGAPPAPAP